MAVDDLGAETASLAMMPLVRPEVVKLDLRLVQARPDSAVADIVHAVNAHAERTGAAVLAEGIETVEHLARARALGAAYGQGWFFGRPGPLPTPGDGVPVARLDLGPLPVPTPAEDLRSPWRLAEGREPRRVTKPLLVALSQHLEAQGLALGETALVLGAFQTADRFTPVTAQRYGWLADRTALTVALGADMPAEPVPGVRGGHLEADDPLLLEWDVVVLAPHFAAALVARDLLDDVPQSQRRFDHVLTYDRDLVVAVAEALLERLPDETGEVHLSPAAALRGRAHPVPAQRGTPVGRELRDLAAVQQRALDASTSGVCIADATQAGFPLVWVNAAFERLSGWPASTILGDSCRFMQGPGTDPAALRRLAEHLSSSRAVDEVLLNYRGPEAHALVEPGAHRARPGRGRARDAGGGGADRRHRAGGGRDGAAP